MLSSDLTPHFSFILIHRNPSHDIEYDSTSQCAYEKFICDLKEELQTWDKIFDNLTHTLVKKVEKWIEDKKSAKEIIDILKSECLEQNR